MQRVAAVVGFVAVALVATGCSGKTTGATDVTRTTARLNAQGSCDQDCSYYLRFARTTDAGWPDRSATMRPYVTPVRSGIGSTHGSTGGFGEAASMLLPDTAYRYQACGRDVGYSGYVCVGPDGKTETSSTFTTRPGDYVFGSSIVTGGTMANALFSAQVSSTPSGGSPEGEAFTFGKAGLGRGGAVTCLRVKGSRVVIGTRDTFFFIKDGPGDQPGYFIAAPTNGDASTCPSVRSGGDANGNVIAEITVHDSTP